jgi:hypothetical protein
MNKITPTERDMEIFGKLIVLNPRDFERGVNGITLEQLAEILHKAEEDILNRAIVIADNPVRQEAGKSFETKFNIVAALSALRDELRKGVQPTIEPDTASGRGDCSYCDNMMGWKEHCPKCHGTGKQPNEGGGK